MKDRLHITSEGPFNKLAFLDEPANDPKKKSKPSKQSVTIPKGTKVLDMGQSSGLLHKCKHANKVLWLQISDLVFPTKEE